MHINCRDFRDSEVRVLEVPLYNSGNNKRITVFCFQIQWNTWSLSYKFSFVSRSNFSEDKAECKHFSSSWASNIFLGPTYKKKRISITIPQNTRDITILTDLRHAQFPLTSVAYSSLQTLLPCPMLHVQKWKCEVWIKISCLWQEDTLVMKLNIHSFD